MDEKSSLNPSSKMTFLLVMDWSCLSLTQTSFPLKHWVSFTMSKLALGNGFTFIESRGIVHLVEV